MKNYIYEAKDGTQVTMREHFYSLMWACFVIGLVIGMFAFLSIQTFQPSYTQSVANQICRSYDGYTVAWEWNIFKSNFGNLICKTSYGLIQPLK